MTDDVSRYARAQEIVRDCVPCTCHEAYRTRDLADPKCGWCQGGADVVDDLMRAGLTTFGQNR